MDRGFRRDKWDILVCFKKRVLSIISYHYDLSGRGDLFPLIWDLEIQTFHKISFFALASANFELDCIGYYQYEETGKSECKLLPII